MSEVIQKRKRGRPRKNPPVEKKPIDPTWRKRCGYSRWGNHGPVEERGQISAPLSKVKLFWATFNSKQRRQAISVALDWVCNNKEVVEQVKKAMKEAK